MSYDHVIGRSLSGCVDFSAVFFFNGYNFYGSMSLGDRPLPAVTKKTKQPMHMHAQKKKKQKQNKKKKKTRTNKPDVKNLSES